MLLKEDFKPNSYDRFAYAIAPLGGVRTGAARLCRDSIRRHAQARFVVPERARAGRDGSPTGLIRCRSRALDAGLLVVFAFGGVTIIGAMLAGWSSSNKFSLLGALRAGSQMISYELVMGLTVLGLIVIYGTRRS